jgi:hypothetical protein
MMNWFDIKHLSPRVGETVLGYRPFASERGDEEFTVLKYEGNVTVDHKGNEFGFERCHFVSHWLPLIKPYVELEIEK